MASLKRNVAEMLLLERCSSVVVEIVEIVEIVEVVEVVEVVPLQ